jgi:iron complex outermembrane receptor protein
MNYRAFLLIGAATAVGFPHMASAQSVVANDAADDNNMIIVTAERRETSVQDISASIQVVSGESLTKIGIVDTENLQVRVPGLVTSRLGGPTQRPYLRGIGNDLYGIASGNSVATYVDGVYVPNSTQSFQAFNDLDRLEVLKGPQAVLYGRNATGGTILITSKKPEFDFGANGDISYGNYNDLQIRGAVTGPLSENIAGRLGVQYLDRDGFGTNLPSGKDQDFFTNFAVRGSILANLSDRLSVLLTADYSKIKTGDFVNTPNPDAWNYQATTGQYIADPWKRYGQHDSYAPVQDKGIKLRLDWETGLGDVTSVTSYRKFKYGPFTYDNDGVGMPLSLPTTPPIVLGELWVNGSVQRSKQFSHETFLATNADKPFRAIVGASVFLEKSAEFQRSIFFAYRYSDRYLNNPAYSAYADFKYDIAPKLTLSAGARYSHERKTYSLTPLTVDAAGTITGQGAEVTGRANWSQFTPRFGIEFRPSSDLLFFVTATRGFKSGGFNTDDPTNEFAPENIWSYEGGVKASWGRMLTTNLSAFYYDYSNLQVQQVLLPSGKSIVTNAASAKIYGLDGEIALRPTRDLTLGANFALMHSEYGDLTLFNDLLAVPTNVSVKGNVLKRAPKASVMSYLDYRTDVGIGELSFRGEAVYRSRTYYTPFQDEPHSQPGFWLLNANVRFEFDGGKQYVSLYGQNLTNKLYATSIEDVARFVGPLDGAPLYSHYGPPRTYGVRYGISF